MRCKGCWAAAALADDLRRFERGEPIAARRLGRLSRLVRWARRRPTTAALSLALLVAALLALVLLGGWLYLTGQRTANQRAAEEDLREAALFQQQSDLAGARAAVERAKGRLGDNGPAELRQRVEQAGRDLELVARLEAIRLDCSHPAPRGRDADPAEPAGLSGGKKSAEK